MPASLHMVSLREVDMAGLMPTMGLFANRDAMVIVITIAYPGSTFPFLPLHSHTQAQSRFL